MNKYKAVELQLPWISQPAMRVVFTNKDTGDAKTFRLVTTFHKSQKGGFDKPIPDQECEEILKKENETYSLGSIVKK